MKYADRGGKRWEETTFQDRLLERMYGSLLGRILVKVLARPWISRLGGKVLDTRISALLVPGFIKSHHMNPEQWVKQEFCSYNDFFTRQYKTGLRKTEKNRERLISPCDGKVTVYPINGKERLVIKHTSYSLAGLLKNRKLARRFQDGYAYVIRLTVDDYHRYCYVDDGIKSSNYKIPGVFHTVNPVANDWEPIYKENTREYCLLHTENFGTVLMMEVGALLVGKIHNYHGAGTIKRGQEKGRFEFGGSTVILLTERGKVTPDKDLLLNSRHGYETLVKMGEGIGRRSR